MNINNIEVILKLIEKYGLSLVLLVVVVFTWIIPEIKRMRDRDNHDGNKRLEKTLVIEQSIVNVLNQTINDLNCQWAVVWQFHNGMLSAARVPFMKMSVTHEATANEVISRGESYQGIPIAVFIDAVMAVIENGVLHINLYCPYQSVVNSYKRDGVASGNLAVLKDIKDNTMGILSISYKDRTTPLNNEELEKFKEASVRVSVLLEELAQAYRHPRRRSYDM